MKSRKENATTLDKPPQSDISPTSAAKQGAASLFNCSNFAALIERNNDNRRERHRMTDSNTTFARPMPRFKLTIVIALAIVAAIAACVYIVSAHFDPHAHA